MLAEFIKKYLGAREKEKIRALSDVSTSHLLTFFSRDESQIFFNGSFLALAEAVCRLRERINVKTVLSGEYGCI